MYNKAIFMGRIVNDLEVKTTPSGAEVLSFRIAVERKYQADKENRVSDFFNIVAWRNTALFISRYFSKGRMILVEGELQTRQYEDKNGNKVTVTELVVDNANFTGEKSNNSNSGTSYTPPAAPMQPQNVQVQPQESDFETTPLTEDYPF